MKQIVATWFVWLERIYSTDGRVVDLFLDRNPRLHPGVRRYLELLRNTAMRLYEVVDLSPGKWEFVGRPFVNK